MKRILITLVAFLLSAVPLSAQTYLTTTTLSNAVTSTSADTVVLAAATTADVGGILYVDHEALEILSISGTSVRVRRGAVGSKGALHGSGATVIIVPKSALAGNGPFGLSAVGQTDPPAGACTTSPYRYLPIINAVTGDVWSCRWSGSGTLTTKTWNPTNVVGLNGTGSLIVQ